MAARTLQTAGITGVGMSFPEKRLTNADLEKMVETDDQWIVERTGIKERRIAPKGTGASVHGAKAAQQALAHAGVAAEDVDLIIVPTVTPDMIFPATACIIQDMIGAKKAWGFDLEGACSGFLFALQNARAQIEAGHAEKVLVIEDFVTGALRRISWDVLAKVDRDRLWEKWGWASNTDSIVKGHRVRQRLADGSIDDVLGFVEETGPGGTSIRVGGRVLRIPADHIV